MTGVSTSIWDPRNSARCSSVKPPPRPWLATCRADTQPVRTFQISTGARATSAVRRARTGPCAPERRPALRREPQVESQSGQDKEHRVLRETPYPDREPEEEPCDGAASDEGPMSGPEPQGPRDDERRVNRREEAARPDEWRQLEADHRERAGLGSPEQLASQSVDGPRREQAEEDGAQADTERGGPEHRREPRDEVRDERALRVVREIQPAGPFPVMRLVRREVEVAEREESESEPCHGEEDGDQDPARSTSARRGFVHGGRIGALKDPWPVRSPPAETRSLVGDGWGCEGRRGRWMHGSLAGSPRAAAPGRVGPRT